MRIRKSHPRNVLSAVRLNSLSKPGRYSDGNALYLVVDPSGAKRWLLRTLVHGRRRDIGLGSLRLVTLAQARDKAVAYRKIAREGGNPLVEARRARKAVPTFTQAAEKVHAEHSCAWRNPKHVQQWINTLKDYVVSRVMPLSISIASRNLVGSEPQLT